jgi:hypothetical protein
MKSHGQDNHNAHVYTVSPTWGSVPPGWAGLLSYIALYANVQRRTVPPQTDINGLKKKR